MKIRLHTQIFIAIAVGILCGVFLKDITPVYITPFGQIFMRLLKLLVLPLVFTSVTLGIVSIGDAKHLGSISLRTFIYFVATGIISSTLGLIIANIFQPGHANAEVTAGLKKVVENEPPPLHEMFVTIAPQNIFESLAKGEILPAIVFAIMLGVALTHIGEKGKPITDFFEASCAAIMKITDWIIALTPIGVFALSATIVAEMGLKSLISVGSYFACVTAGLLIHGFIILPIILLVFAKYPPIVLFRKLLPSLAIAVPTASSAAAYPVTMECLNKSVGVPNRITSFVISLGTTMNMDGTALYQAIAVMFIAQMYGIDLGFAQQAIIVLTALLASVGAAALPGAGIVTMVMILNAVGVPVEGIGIILAVDRILDTGRTFVNVWSNVCGAVIVAKLDGVTLDPKHSYKDPPSDETKEVNKEIIEKSSDDDKELEIAGKN